MIKIFTPSTAPLREGEIIVGGNAIIDVRSDTRLKRAIQIEKQLKQEQKKIRLKSPNPEPKTQNPSTSV